MILRFLLLAVLTMLIVRSLRTLMRGVVSGATTGGGSSGPVASVKLMRDPVCGTHVSPRTAVSVSSKGATYYFCSEKCREEFGKRA